MKSIKIKIIASFMALSTLLTSTALSVSAETAFTDVTQDKWFYSTVMAMTQQGLFAGYDDGTFRPGNSMTRAEFLTVVCRILELDTSSSGGNWWDGAYYSALNNGLIKETEMQNNDKMGSPISRREMAMVAIRTMEKRGETVALANEANVKAAIPDFISVGGYFNDFVLKAYANGIITGYDGGEFRPDGALNRAEAATVLNRIIDAGARVQQDFSQKPVEQTKPSDDQSGPITIKEGTIEKRRFAQPGDTVVKADGSTYVLEIGPHGVLGEGQPVAADLGLEVTGGSNVRVVDKGVFSGYTEFEDSTGERVMNQHYYVNNITQEGHWSAEWRAMTSKPTTPGSFANQLSEDKNWIWSGTTQEWVQVYAQRMTDNAINMVRQANGLN